MIDGTTVFMIIRVLVLAFLLWLFYGVVRSCVFVMRGSPERAPRLGSQIIGLVIAFILLWPITGIRLELRYLEWRYRPQMYEVAEALGYTFEDFLVEDSGCWDTAITLPPLATERCEIFLHFTTDLSATELAPLVAELPADSIFATEGSDTLARQITRLAVETSVSEDRDFVSSNAEVQVYSYPWLFSDNDKSFQRIELYETSTVMGLEFNGKPITKNIVRVDVVLGAVHLY